VAANGKNRQFPNGMPIIDLPLAAQIVRQRKTALIPHHFPFGCRESPPLISRPFYGSRPLDCLQTDLYLRQRPFLFAPIASAARGRHINEAFSFYMLLALDD
jgi:hypothetical protein